MEYLIACGWLTALEKGVAGALSQLAGIEPACDIAIEIIGEAQALDSSDKPPFRESLRLLTNWEVFDHLVRLNPSLPQAIKLCDYRGAAAAPADPN